MGGWMDGWMDGSIDRWIDLLSLMGKLLQY